MALPASRMRDELAVDELDRADIDAARRLADEQQLGVALDLAGEHDLLLVAAGEIGVLSRGFGGRMSNFCIFAGRSRDHAPRSSRRPAP